ncbi:hypothetical protein FGB62_230g018 [Gracilaria domingensis]|nr:hypothetical protein FGB62_230g018 [Gracilaria domingensis]
MSSYPHGSPGGGGKRPPWGRGTLGLNGNGSEERSAKRTRRQRSERVRELQNSAGQGLSSSAADIVAWITAVYQEATGTLPAGARVPQAPAPIFDPVPEPTQIGAASEPLPPVSPSAAGASASSSGAPFRCPHCEKSYANQDALREHVRRKHDHGNVRYCPHCPYVSDRQAFHVHQRSHRRSHPPPGPLPQVPSSGKSWRCPHCIRVYRSRSHLADHVRKSHDRGGRRHCNKCNFITEDIEAFSAHRRAHNGWRLCPNCRRRIHTSESEDHLHMCAKRG